MKSDYIVLDMDRGVGLFEIFGTEISSTPLVMTSDLASLRTCLLEMFYAASDIVTENYYDDWKDLEERPLDNPESDSEDDQIVEWSNGETRVRGRGTGWEMPLRRDEGQSSPRTDSLTGVQGDSEQLSEEVALSGHNWD